MATIKRRTEREPDPEDQEGLAPTKAKPGPEVRNSTLAERAADRASRAKRISGGENKAVTSASTK